MFLGFWLFQGFLFSVVVATPTPLLRSIRSISTVLVAGCSDGDFPKPSPYDPYGGTPIISLQSPYLLGAL